MITGRPRRDQSAIYARSASAGSKCGRGFDSRRLHALTASRSWGLRVFGHGGGGGRTRADCAKQDAQRGSSRAAQVLSKTLTPTRETTEDGREAPTAGHSRRLNQKALTTIAVIRAFCVTKPVRAGRLERPRRPSGHFATDWWTCRAVHRPSSRTKTTVRPSPTGSEVQPALSVYTPSPTALNTATSGLRRRTRDSNMVCS